MSEEHELPHDDITEPDEEETLEERLQALVARHAEERGALAEQISLLQEENYRLIHRIKELETASFESAVSVTRKYQSLTSKNNLFDFGDNNEQPG